MEGHMTDTNVLYEDTRDICDEELSTTTQTQSSSTLPTTTPRGKERERAPSTESRLSPRGSTSASSSAFTRGEGKAAAPLESAAGKLGVAAPAAVAGVTPGTETYQVARAGQAHIVRAPMRWLLAMDENEGAGWAFNHVLNNMDRANDTLILITVSTKKIVEEHFSREVLLRYAIRAERLGLKNVKLWLHMGKEVGPVLCNAAKETGANTLVLGHSRVRERWWGISTSQYCHDNAPCTVIIVQEKQPLQGADILAEAQMRDDLDRRKRLGVPDVEDVVREPIVETFEKHLTVNGKTYAVEVSFL